MGDTISDYMHMVVSTIIFASAIAFLFACMGILSSFNKNEISDMNTRSSVSMDTNNAYTEPVIYIKGSSVFSDIMEQDKDVTITLDGLILSPEFLKSLREKDSSSITDLRSRLVMDGDYLLRHEYYSTNKIKAVAYSHR